MSLSPRRRHHGNVRVLVVEDQRVLADRIAEGLRDQGMAVDVTYDGEAAMEITAFTAYDVIVLDRDLPRRPCPAPLRDPRPARATGPPGRGRPRAPPRPAGPAAPGGDSCLR